MPSFYYSFPFSSFRLMITHEFGGTIVIKVANEVGTTERFFLSFENAIHFVDYAEKFLKDSGLDDPRNWTGDDSLDDPQKAFCRFKQLMPDIADNELDVINSHEVKYQFAFGIEERMPPYKQLVTIQTSDTDDRVQVFLCTPAIHYMLIDRIKACISRFSANRH